MNSFIWISEQMIRISPWKLGDLVCWSSPSRGSARRAETRRGSDRFPWSSLWCFPFLFITWKLAKQQSLTVIRVCAALGRRFPGSGGRFVLPPGCGESSRGAGTVRCVQRVSGAKTTGECSTRVSLSHPLSLHFHSLILSPPLSPLFSIVSLSPSPSNSHVSFLSHFSFLHPPFSPNTQFLLSPSFPPFYFFHVFFTVLCFRLDSFHFIQMIFIDTMNKCQYGESSTGCMQTSLMYLSKVAGDL